MRANNGLNANTYPGAIALLAERPELVGIGIAEALDLARWSA